MAHGFASSAIHSTMLTKGNPWSSKLEKLVESLFGKKGGLTAIVQYRTGLELSPHYVPEGLISVPVPQGGVVSVFPSHLGFVLNA